MHASIDTYMHTHIHTKYVHLVGGGLKTEARDTIPVRAIDIKAFIFTIIISGAALCCSLSLGNRNLTFPQQDRVRDVHI